jgi:hypothetical protein
MRESLIKEVVTPEDSSRDPHLERGLYIIFIMVIRKRKNLPTPGAVTNRTRACGFFGKNVKRAILRQIDRASVGLS